MEVVNLPPIPEKVVAFSVMTGGQVKVAQTDQDIQVSVPKPDRNEIDTIVVLELQKP